MFPIRSDNSNEFPWKVECTGCVRAAVDWHAGVQDAKIDQQESNKDVEVSQDDLEEEAGDQATESRGDQAKNYLVDKT